MQNWDDKTEDIIEFTNVVGIQEKLITEQNLNTEKFKCSHFRNGVQVGVSAHYDTREQSMAWMRLMLGDYADCHRGVA